MESTWSLARCLRDMRSLPKSRTFRKEQGTSLPRRSQLSKVGSWKCPKKVYTPSSRWRHVVLPSTVTIPCAYTLPEPIYSTAHPGFEGEPDDENVAIPAPAGDAHSNNTKVPALVNETISQGYASSFVFVMVIVAVVAWFVRRRTSRKMNEKFEG